MVAMVYKQCSQSEIYFDMKETVYIYISVHITTFRQILNPE